MAKEAIVTAIDTDTGKSGKSVSVQGDAPEDVNLLPNEEEIVVKKDDKKEPELDIQIVDDTPTGDRGRKPLAKKPDLADQEIEEYSETVKKRINELRHGFHDERRAKEAAFREREEAVRVAKDLHNRLKEQEKKHAEEQVLFVKNLKEKAEVELAAAKKAFEKAYDKGDGAEIAAAQEAISQATINREIALRTKVPEIPIEKTVDREQKESFNSQQQQTHRPQVDPKAEQWVKKNPWFMQDEEMTSFAYGVHEKLVKAGVHPVEDADEYYERINVRMREKFPEYEWGDERKPQRKQESKTATVVAPVQRTNKGTKVTLTTTQVALAKRLGLKPEEYARELLKTMESNNNG